MIAELAENATMFSPPNTPVVIHGDTVGKGFAVEIEDRGLGMSDEQFARVNGLLENPPPFDPSSSDQLGLFVAGQLAKRHDIKISLRPSPYGGTTAIVLIPQTWWSPRAATPRTRRSGLADGTLRFKGRHALDWARDDGDGAARPGFRQRGDVVDRGRDPGHAGSGRHGGPDPGLAAPLAALPGPGSRSPLARLTPATSAGCPGGSARRAWRRSFATRPPAAPAQAGTTSGRARPRRPAPP